MPAHSLRTTKRSSLFTARRNDRQGLHRRNALRFACEQLEARRVFAAPDLGVINDQNLVAGQTSSAITLNATDIDTPITSLTFTGESDSQLYALDQELELDTYLNGTNYFTNVRGSGEKYLYNTETDTWFYLLANGDLYRFTGDRDSTAPASLSGTLVANVGTDVYADPTLLHEATSNDDDLTFQFTGGANPSFTITPTANAEGTYVATVTVSDGVDVDTETFVVVVTETAPPVLNPIANQTVIAGDTTAAINLTVSDPDTPTAAITFTADSESQLYLLDQEYGLGTYQNGTNYFLDVRGSDEKYLYNANTDTWFYILANGNLYQFTGDRDSTAPASLSGTLIANVGTEVYANPTLLSNAVSLDDALDIQFNPGLNPTMTIEADSNVSGTFEVTVTASDGTNVDTQTFLVVVTNGAPPELDPIADQTLTAGDTTSAIPISVSDDDTTTANLTFTSTVESELYLLDQEYDLDTYQNGTNYFFDVRGSDEKYLYNAQTDTWFYILANGDLYQFTGNRDSTAPASLSGTLITNVGTEVYADPTLLHEAESLEDSIDIVFTPGANPTFTIEADADVSGTFVATVTASDGVNIDTDEFLITVNPTAPPVLVAVSDQTVVAGESTAVINIGVTDADTPTANLTYSATVNSELYLLDQEYDLDTYQNGTNYFFDVRGSDEKYLYNAGTDTWFYILANGDLYQFTGNRDSTAPASLSGTLITNVGTEVYADPSLLHEAVSASDDLDFQFTPGANPTLVISADPDALGTYIVTLTATDGVNIDTDTFEVVVTPSAPPVLAAISDQNLVAGEASSVINLGVTDADTATADLSFSATANSELYSLDQEYGLGTYQNGTNLFFDVRGSDEKYLYNTQSDTWFYILPNGNLYEFTGNRDSTAPASLSGSLITNVGTEVYADPSLLHDAESLSDDLDFQFTGGANPTLIITPDADASGTYVVTVSATDGVNVDTDTFVVVVTPTAPPVLNAIATQTVEVGDSTGVINLSVSDADTATAALTFTGTANTELYALDQEYDLDTYQNGTNYFFDVRGSDEKYLYNAGTDTWFYILANGDLYQFTGDRDSTAPASLSGTLITNVGTEVYADPTLLHEAISIADALTFQFNTGLNPTLVISAEADAEPGEYLATVTASDGVSVDSQTFVVVVTDTNNLMAAQSEPMSSESVDAVLGSDDDSWLAA